MLLYRGERPLRFVAGLALGALLAHLGWALLHLPVVVRQPASLFDASSGFSVLFVPLGPLLLMPTAASLATLPAALAVARLGCLAAGCCHASGGQPLPLAEVAGLAALHRAVGRLGERWVPPAVLAGLGLLRLATEPWRAPPALGEPLLAPAAIAALWLVVAVVAGLRPRALWAARRPPGARRSPG